MSQFTTLCSVQLNMQATCLSYCATPSRNLRRRIALSTHLSKFIRKDRVLSSLVGTTQAITLISGGVKSNALPERASAVVNHRIAVVRYAFVLTFYDVYARPDNMQIAL